MNKWWQRLLIWLNLAIDFATDVILIYICHLIFPWWVVIVVAIILIKQFAPEFLLSMAMMYE